MLIVCRLVGMTPIPGLDGLQLAAYFEEQARSSNNEGASVFGLVSLFTGGALEKCAIGSLGIMPYISATIVLQLLTAVVPILNRLVREEGGRAKIVAYGRYLTVLLCLGQGLVLAIGWENPEKTFPGFSGALVLLENTWAYRFQTVVILTTGTLMLMWLGEQITERGIGNGISLVITIGILAQLPVAFRSLVTMFTPTLGNANWLYALFLLILLIIVIGSVVVITLSQRRIPVQYAQRAVGRKVYSGGTSFMPIRLNYAGVMPVIFAQAILMFPSLILEKLSSVYDIELFRSIARLITYGSWFHLFCEAMMIMFFSYFWVATQFNELQVADDLKKYGGYIPGVRPGSATSDYLRKLMGRITFAGALFLVCIAIFPTILTQTVNIDYTVSQFFGGTSILIIVGVLLDTMRQIESFLLTRNYDGFLKYNKNKH